MSGRGSRGNPTQGRGRGDRGGGRGSERGAARGGGRGGGRGVDLPFRDAPPRDGRGDQGGRGRGRGDGRGDYRGGSRGGDSRGGRGRGGGVREQARIYSAVGGVPDPDPAVAKTEEDIEKNVLSKRVAISDSTSKNPVRPGFGTRGRPILLYANYFVLAANLNQPLYHYSISINPQISGRPISVKKSNIIIRLFLEQHLGEYQNSIASDFRSTLISRTKLPLANGTYSVRYKAPEEDEYPSHIPPFNITFLATVSSSVTELVDYLTSADASARFDSKAQVLQALNIVVGHHPKTDPNTTSVGANKHLDIRQDPFSLGGGLEALRGFFVSVRAATARLLVNVQVKNIACYQSGELAGLIMGVQPRPPSAYELIRLERFLKGVRVQVTHLKTNKNRPRVKTIFGFAGKNDGQGPNRPKVPKHGDGPAKVQFWLEPTQTKKVAGPQRAAGYISVADYFRQYYNLNTNPNLPVTNVGSRENPSYLPVEVCVVIPGQPANTKLSPNQTANMITFAVRSPGANADSIVNEGAQVLGMKPINATLNGFGIGTPASLITVPGRVLGIPSVSYSAGKSIQPRNGEWNMRDTKFFKPADSSPWTYLRLTSKRERPLYGDFETALTGFSAKLSEMGMKATRAPGGEIVGIDQPGWETRVEDAIDRITKRVNPKFVLILLPSTDAEVYNFIKLTCDVRRGVLHGCVLAEKFIKDNNDQYFANEGLKVNLKLGGTNQMLSNNQLGVIDQGKTMLVGIDVTHPSPGSSKNAPSVAGIVASVDKYLGQFPGAIQIQTARQEQVEALNELLKGRLQRWRLSNNGALPENILVYRDGVSEGQYAMVINDELPLLKRACEETYPATDTKNKKPRISIVVVGKRHHTRFYATSQADAEARSKNPPNGTVVDRGVTEARNWDFFLQAHKALQGTARPAHYYTVYDEIFRGGPIKPPFRNPADTLEDLTHRLCYLFGRATKAVSICPPAYYADLVCERARCYLSKVYDATPSGSTPSGSTPSGSITGGSATTTGNQPLDDENMRLHERIRDRMFYI